MEPEYFFGTCYWYDSDKRYGCIADLSGATHLFRTDCLARDYIPASSDIIAFRISYDVVPESARNDGTIITIEPVDTDTICDDDMETLTKLCVEYREKEDRKRIRASKSASRQLGGVKPLRDRWAE